MGLFGSLYAAGYERFAARMDQRGAAAHRRHLAEPASGEVLEIGAGTGRNTGWYRAAARVVALESDARMRARGERAARAAAVPVEVIVGDAMALPFADGTFDTVVAGLVLCTVPPPARSPRPGGSCDPADAGVLRARACHRPPAGPLAGSAAAALAVGGGAATPTAIPSR